MMERIADHLTYLSVYATGFQNSEKVQKVRVVYHSNICVFLLSINKFMMTLFFQALVAAYCDLLDFYVKVRKLFSNKEGKPSCKWKRF